MTDDDKMDALLRQMAAEEYNRPPHIVPREQMWDVISQGLRTGDSGLGDSKVVPLTRGSRVPRWVYFAVAAVALLAVGIQLGRMIGANQTIVKDPTPQAPVDSLGRPMIDTMPITSPARTPMRRSAATSSTLPFRVTSS